MHVAMMALAALVLLCLVCACVSTEDAARHGWCAIGLIAGTPLAILTFVALA